jgi:23S rRNA (cytosine1962-C5)-methyltransferase
VDRDHPWLLERCARLLRPGGILYFSTNSRGFSLLGDPPGLVGSEISEASVPEDFRNRRIHRCWRWTRNVERIAP